MSDLGRDVRQQVGDNGFAAQMCELRITPVAYALMAPGQSACGAAKAPRADGLTLCGENQTAFAAMIGK